MRDKVSHFKKNMDKDIFYCGNCKHYFPVLYRDPDFVSMDKLSMKHYVCKWCSGKIKKYPRKEDYVINN